MNNKISLNQNEKGELKYKGGMVRGSNVVDLVNDVLRKKEIFQPTRMGSIRRSITRGKCSTRFDWSRGPLEIHQSDQKNTEISQTTIESLPC
jgi:hypothetical protein